MRFAEIHQLLHLSVARHTARRVSGERWGGFVAQFGPTK
jgi:hypothetical protein